MAETSISVKLPIFVSVRDYHEFRTVADMLTSLGGEKVNYTELDTEPGIGYAVDLDLNGGMSSPYVAIMFTGKHDSHIQDLIREFLGDPEDIVF